MLSVYHLQLKAWQFFLEGYSKIDSTLKSEYIDGYLKMIDPKLRAKTTGEKYSIFVTVIYYFDTQSNDQI